MKRRAILRTLAAGASLAAAPISRSAELAPPITFEGAITIAVREMERRGLAATHRLTALHGAPDARTEGAAFSVSVSPRPDTKVPSDAPDSGRLKLLISHDGKVSLRSWRGGNGPADRKQP